MGSSERYFTELATAFARGRLCDRNATIEDGKRADLRLHKFKNDSVLPRVRRVLGILRGLAPDNLLDVGSGRGTFLWPLLDALPNLPVTCIDVSERRVADLDAVSAGGISRLTAMDIHLFSSDQIIALAKDAGADRTTVGHVLNHRIAVLRVRR